MKVIKKLDNLAEVFPFFSKERDLVRSVRLWVDEARKAVMGENCLELAEAYVDCYKIKLEETGNSHDFLINRLRSIINNAYKTYANKSGSTQR